MYRRAFTWLGLSSWLLYSCSKHASEAQTHGADFIRNVSHSATTVSSPHSPAAGSPGSDDCKNASFEFRRLVSSCFPDHRLCGEVLSVDFDDSGTARGARFAASVSAEHAQAARAVVACVATKLNRLSRCTELRTRSFRQSCTLR